MVVDENRIRARYLKMAPLLDERQRRCFAGAEAAALGRGGQAAVSRATGLSLPTVRAGLREVERGAAPLQGGRIRREGAGRPRTVERDPTLRADLEALIEPTSRGDPESPLRWTCKSIRRLAEELTRTGHKTSHRMVAALLHEMGYSLQANRKVLEGSSHPDRNAQFEHLNAAVERQLSLGEPVISVDTKKKELVGPFKSGGRELRPKGEPEQVRVHDFLIPELGRANPYGVYDLAQNEAWVSVGTDHDTAAFAVASIRRWWHTMGQPAYPNAQRVLITADGGGSNSDRTRLWKTELQKVANETGLEISVCHLPPGTSKWNKIEHRLFSYITQNWRGKPLVSHEVMVNLMASTTTRTGLTVRCELDTNKYPKGIRITDKELHQVNISRDQFHGEWNYTIKPHSS